MKPIKKESDETPEAEKARMFSYMVEKGMVVVPGVCVSEEEGGGIGQFLFSPSLNNLVDMTMNPLPYLGGATKAEKARWKEDEREHADLYGLVQRDFKNKKKENVGKLIPYVISMLEGNMAGFLPPPLLWFQHDDIEVSTHYLAVKRKAVPHALDGSTRLAAIHEVYELEGGRYRAKMEKVKMPVIAMFGDGLGPTEAAQIFCDVNFKAIPVDPSLVKSLDMRDLHSLLAREVEGAIASLKGRVAARRQLTSTDVALVTRYALYQALRCFTDGVGALAKSYDSEALNKETQASVTVKAIDFWRELEKLFGEQWAEPGGRDRYLHLQAPVLKAICAYGAQAYFPDVSVAVKAKVFARLQAIDWNRAHPGWTGIVTRAGEGGANIMNSDPAVRELAKLLETDDARLPRVQKAA